MGASNNNNSFLLYTVLANGVALGYANVRTHYVNTDSRSVTGLVNMAVNDTIQVNFSVPVGPNYTIIHERFSVEWSSEV